MKTKPPENPDLNASTRKPHAPEQTQSAPERGSWRAWLQKFGPRLLLFARQQTRTQEDAEDLLQDALIKLVDKLEAGTFSGGQESWLPFLYTAIRRLAIDLGRKEDRRQTRENRFGKDPSIHEGATVKPWFESESTSDETKQLIESSLKKIPEKYAEVIVMKIWGEQTFADIGEILDISPNTAASRYRYGLKALRKHLNSSKIIEDL